MNKNKRSQASNGPSSERKENERRWKQSRENLESHELVSDLRLEIKMFAYAKGIKTWGGVGFLMAAWFFQQIADLHEGNQSSHLVFLVALCLGLGAWKVLCSLMNWIVWWNARRCLVNGKYGNHLIKVFSGMLGGGSLRPVEKGGHRWTEVDEWVRGKKALEHVWKEWNKSMEPIREFDLRVLEEAVLAHRMMEGEQENLSSSGA